jgi:hypothetical protein
MVASSSSGTIFKLDIAKFARDVMSEVDGVRSYLPAVGDDSQQADNRPTESRVNAFFRLIGLPMVVSISPMDEKDKSATKASQQTLTPGFAMGDEPPGIIEDSGDAKLPDPVTGNETPLSDLLADREEMLLDLERKIGTPEIDQRRVDSFYNPLALALDVGTSKRVSPFVVSYRRIYPAQNELSKPFLADPEDGRTPLDSSPIRRPFVETVVRIRVNALEGGNQQQQDYLAGARARMRQLSSTAADALPTEASAYEAFIIDQMLGSINQFADAWVKLQRRRERIATDESIVLKPKTSSAKANPFGKQGNVATTVEFTNTSNTGQPNLGRRIADLNRSIAVDEALISLLPTQDLASLAGDEVKNVMPNALTNPFVAMLRQPIDWQRKKLAEVNTQVDAIAQQADRLRLELEAMTGEFSGLSLPDVAFTILALFLIDKDNLFGLLDQSTKDQMSLDPALDAALKASSPSSTFSAVSSLRDKVVELYDALGEAIAQRIDKSKRTSLSSAPLASSDIVGTVDAAQRAQDDLEQASET